MIGRQVTSAVPTSPLQFQPAGIRWHYLKAEGRTWLEALPTENSPGQVIKASVRRWVLRFAPGVYLKEVRYHSVRALAKSVAGGNACREGAMLLRLARLGVPVPEVLAFGSQRRCGILTRDVLITKEVEADGSLLHFMQKDHPSLVFRTKRQVTADFADFIRNLHDLGVIQRDLHIDNLMVRRLAAGTDFVLLDAQRVTIKARSLTSTERAENLAVLLCNFWSLAGTTQCFRFLRCYGLGWKTPEERDRLQHIKQLALALSRRSWDAHACQSLTTNAHFIKEARDSFGIYRIRRDEEAELLDRLLPDPDRILDQGVILKDGRTVKAARVDIDGRHYFLKRYNCKGWGYRLRNAFRRSRAKRVWLNTWGFWLRHLPVPQPLICLEERRLRLLERSYVLSAYVQDARPLNQVWQDLDESQRHTALIHIAMLLGRIHRFGGAHGDLKWNNLLLTIANGTPRVIFSDLDGSRVIPAASRLKRIKDVRRFLRDLEERDTTGLYRELFLRTWRHWANGRHSRYY
jgi:tRNA A-37 threonylcarbamoyl transferase component Bud32